METQDQIKRLQIRVNFLIGLSVILVIIVVGLLFYGQNKFNTITVRRIDFVDAKGRSRFTIASPLPNPVVQGKESQRSTNVYGIQLKDSLGNEVGGLGIEDNLNARLLCFDYETAEAMCVIKYRDDVGLSMFSKPRPNAPIGQTGVQRIAMGVSNSLGMAFLILLDNNGKERIKLSVDSTNVAQIQMLDENGNVIYKIP